jgi:hypothetical protein
VSDTLIYQLELVSNKKRIIIVEIYVLGNDTFYIFGSWWVQEKLPTKIPTSVASTGTDRWILFYFPRKRNSVQFYVST